MCHRLLITAFICLFINTAPIFAQTIDGILVPTKDVTIKTTIDGIVKSVSLKEGTTVEKDIVIVQFDSREQEAKLQLAKTIASGTAAVQIAKNRANIAQRKYNDLRKAMTNGAATDWEVEDALANKQIAVLDHKAANEEKTANLQRQKLEEEILARYQFTSPFAGTINEIYVSEGQSVSRGEKIARLVSVKTLEIEAYIDAEHHALLSIGNSYRGKISSPFDLSFRANLIHIDSIFDAATGTIRAVFSVDNQDNLPAGVSAEIYLTDKLSLSIVN